MSFKTATVENFEQTCDDFLKKNLAAGLDQIEHWNLETYKHLLFNENNRAPDGAFVFKGFKSLSHQNLELSKQYFKLLQTILKYSYLSFKQVPDKTPTS